MVFEIDPSVVRPGWTPLIITVVLAIAMVFLYRSMKRQFGRIRHLPTEAEAAAQRAAARKAAADGPGVGDDDGPDLNRDDLNRHHADGSDTAGSSTDGSRTDGDVARLGEPPLQQR